MTDLGGKRVLVTGASQRLGAVLAQAFAARGAAVVVHCFRSREEADALASSLPPAPRPDTKSSPATSPIPIPCGVSPRSSARSITS
jgi:NAD(P)-dependent dehydrogenase (short-subunit alcohol dehydrogenase family)